MEIISNNALISINETLIVQVISFLIFLYIINRIMFRPLRKIMNERENHIQKIQQDIASSENKYQTLTRQLKKQESEVKTEAFAARQELEKAGNQQADEIFASSKKEMDDLRRNAAREIEAQLENARKQLAAESETLALNIMEKVLGRRLQS
jgi:F-type H+-transporting ATPase subunit b